MKQIKLLVKHLKYAFFNSIPPQKLVTDIATCKYADYKHKIRSGDVMAVATGNDIGFTDKIFANIVSYMTGYKIYHVATMLVTDDRYFALEAIIPRVTLSLLSARTPFYHFQLSEDLPRLMSDEEFVTHAFTKLGLPYSVKDVLVAYWETNLDSTNGVICTELVASLLHDLTNLNTDSELIPGAYVKLLQELGFKVTYVV